MPCFHHRDSLDKKGEWMDKNSSTACLRSTLYHKLKNLSQNFMSQNHLVAKIYSAVLFIPVKRRGKKRLIYLFLKVGVSETEGEWDRVHELSSAGSLPRWPSTARAGPGQSQEIRLLPGFLVGGRDPSLYATFLCFPRMSRRLNQKLDWCEALLSWMVASFDRLHASPILNDCLNCNLSSPGLQKLHRMARHDRCMNALVCTILV